LCCGAYEFSVVPQTGEPIALALETGELSEENPNPREPVFLRVVDIEYQAFNVYMTCDSVVFVYEQRGDEAHIQVAVEPVDETARNSLVELEQWNTLKSGEEEAS